MNWLNHKIAETKEQHWAREHPYGEAGSVDYWTEAMRRAFVLGEDRATPEIDKLLEISGPHAPMEFTEFPDWFARLWINNLAPYLIKSDHPHRMPY